jgi:hypothetical protein
MTVVRDIAQFAELRSEIAALRHEMRMIELRRQIEIEITKGQAAWRRLVGAVALWVITNAVRAFGAMFGLAKLLGD